MSSPETTLACAMISKRGAARRSAESLDATTHPDRTIGLDPEAQPRRQCWGGWFRNGRVAVLRRRGAGDPMTWARSMTCVAAAALLGACDAQVTSDYRGEPM